MFSILTPFLVNVNEFPHYKETWTLCYFLYDIIKPPRCYMANAGAHREGSMRLGVGGDTHWFRISKGLGYIEGLFFAAYPASNQRVVI